MKILIIGAGAREHAICWKICQSSSTHTLFIAPGNAGTALLGENVLLDPLDFNKVGQFCLEQNIELVFVGPEEPLVLGIYDHFKSTKELQNIIITGPGKEGAQLEGSKSFAKKFMKKYGIPTAAFAEFHSASFDEGCAYIQSHSLPIVLKADGLAAGKGVLICTTHNEAINEFSSILKDKKFGDAGNKVVVEEFLTGVELSVFLLTDGTNYLLLPEAKDYKKIGQQDTGPNTGGMGAISPVPFATEHFMLKVKEKIIVPTLSGLRTENIEYSGFIFLGLIKVNDEPFVIEYNCRLGDPETETILLRLKNDLVQLLKGMATGNLAEQEIMIDKKSAATIVAVSGGYPGHIEKGKQIDFNYLENPQAIKHIDEAGGGVTVFHAATIQKNTEVLTNGGRVLTASALSDSLPEALELCIETLSQIHFEGMYYRPDIGYEFVD
ncbi:MAG: phosphoribosylamine--glycine ligase [Bacteroidetes bacterium]|nr:phosphoribosylamine--glycine ligase [Bacteroidota bacterium]